MKDYLGEFSVDISSSPYEHWTEVNWAMYWIGSYGQIDGAHHKTWVLDQVARILKGTRVIVTEARWQLPDGTIQTEFRHNLAEPTVEYLDWVEEMRGSYDPEFEEYEYDYDIGSAP